eukprot:s228_g27.t1
MAAAQALCHEVPVRIVPLAMEASVPESTAAVRRRVCNRGLCQMLLLPARFASCQAGSPHNLKDAKEWGGFIKQSALRRHWQGALSSLHRMSAKALRPNQIAINMVAASAHAQKWTQSLRSLASYGMKDVVALNTALKSWCASVQWEHGLSCIYLAPQLSLTPDIVSYNTFLGGTFGSTWPRSLHVLAKCHNDADVTTYTSAMDPLALSLHWRIGSFLLDKLECSGIQRDEVILGATIAGLGEWRWGTHLLRCFSELSLRADAVAFGASSNSYSQCSLWNQAVGFTALMACRALHSNLATTNSLLKSFSGCWEQATGMMSSIKPDLITANAIAAACDKGQKWQQAMFVVEQVSLFKLSPDSILKSVAVSACQRTSRWLLSVLSTFGDCQRCKGTPTSIVLCNAAMAAMAACKKTWRLAMNLFGQLRCQRLSPNVVTSGAAIESLSNAGQWKLILEMLPLESLEPLAPRDPSPEVWCSALRGSSSRWGVVLGILAMLQQRSGRPDATMLAEITAICHASQQRGVALTFLSRTVQEALLGLGFRVPLPKKASCPARQIPKMAKFVKPNLREVFRHFKEAWVLVKEKLKVFLSDMLVAGRAILAQVLTCHQLIMTLYPSQSAAMQMTTIDALKDHYSVPDALWTSFIQVAGDPGSDMRLLAALPPHVVSAALERAVLPDGSTLSAVQASHVGLLYNLSRRIQYTRGGGDWDAWTDTSPFGGQVMDTNQVTKVDTSGSGSSGTERRLKMTHVLDQGDDGDFVVQSEATRARWYQNCLQVVGGLPGEEEEPSLEQLSALQRRVTQQDSAPYADFAIFVPFGQRALKASRFRTFVLTDSGYISKEIPGPATFTQWRTCYRLLRSSLIMLDIAGLAALHGYEMLVERLARLYPSAWHLIYSADEVARSAQSNRIRAKILIDIRAGKQRPEGFDQDRPWDFVFQALVKDDTFWQNQVHGPALAWIAAGSHGLPKTPAEQLASSSIQGGLASIQPVMDTNAGTKGQPTNDRRKRKRNGRRNGNDGEDQKGNKGCMRCAGDDARQGAQKTKVEQSTKGEASEYSYTYETEGEESEQRQDDPEGDDEGIPLQSATLEEFFTKRVFIFIHHYAGPQDPLTTAMRNEALAQGIRLKAYSVEKMNGTGDLMEDEPYTTHLRWASRGYVDAYHAGFPCSTFSRLRLRAGPNLPRPVRSRSEPYGLSGNTQAEQRECDDGTVMASRAINMATAVCKRPQIAKTPPVSTLENPPPSEDPRHLSAWELGEMDAFRNTTPHNSVLFNTCGYESHLEVGAKHYKPQMFAGSLQGIGALKRNCQCGSPSNHDVITGPQKSKASATYPDELCKEYARLAIAQLKRMGTEEFLKSRMTSLQDTIDAAKAKVVYRGDTLESGPKSTSTTGTKHKAQSPRRDRSRSPRRPRNVPSMSPPTRREYKAATMDDRRRSPPKKRRDDRTPLPRRKRTKRTSSARTPKTGGVSLKPAADVRSDPQHNWQGGEGKYSMLKKSQAKASNPAMSEFVGGMRDPYKAILGRSTLQTLGLRIRAAWEAFERRRKDANDVADTYGTQDCVLNDEVVAEWKAALKKTLGAQAPPNVKMRPRWGYVSPVDPELLEAWIRRSADPDDVTPGWIRTGAPLGIEAEIETRGIFPPNLDEGNLDYHTGHELEDALAQMSRGDLDNYSSVLDNVEEAKIELDRYKAEGYLAEVSKDVVKSQMNHGTISRLGLILKVKPEGVKRRIILDLRRSGGNRKAQLPEKLVLPRPKDAVAMIRNVYAQRRPHGSDEGFTRELAVIDISDAFMSFAVKDEEIPHTLAPDVRSDNFYAFCALLFGFKTAPLIWSRLASQVARFLQSLCEGGEGQHQVYLDDALWCLQGNLRQRNSLLSMIITTLAALGLKVSLKKGLRSTQVQWVGIRFTITDDSIILGLPDKFLKELSDLLISWQDKGMAPLKELRQAAGRLSWLSGILPRARWTVSVFYKVLHERLNDIASGTELHRRASREDQRNKNGLFAVKQLEQARAWLVQFMGVAMKAPTERAGAVLLINGRLVKAYSTKITHRDARLLDFEGEWESSASQGIAEAFAILLALKHWSRELSSCHVELQVQSDSVVALATMQKMSGAKAALNFIGAEVAIECEAIGVEGLICTHIPGAANGLADYLSRPDRMAKEETPPDLKGVPVHRDEEARGPEFYHLTPPQLAPEAAMDISLLGLGHIGPRPRPPPDRREGVSPPPIVAVSQGRSGSGDIHHKENQKFEPSTKVTQSIHRDSDKQARNLEKTPTGRKRRLSDSGLEEISSDEEEDALWKSEEEQVAHFSNSNDLSTKDIKATPPKFPPSPPKGPWWRELMTSPVKRFKWPSWGPLDSKNDAQELPIFALPAPAEAPKTITPVLGTKEKLRKDLPTRRSVLNIPKPQLRNAVKLAKSKTAAKDIIGRVEKEFYANSSRAAKASRVKTVTDILNASNAPFPLTPFSLKLLTGTLKEAGYKSTTIYLAEAKTTHIEKGYPWTHLLDRHYKLCTNAAKRGTGPRKKAPEVPEADWALHPLLPDKGDERSKVNLSAHLFACGVHWMMREIEIAGLTATDAKFDPETRLVSLTWRESKTDTSAKGITRTLQCVCEQGCDLRCPYAVLEVLVNNAGMKGAPGGHLATNLKGQVATKAEVVGAWKCLFGNHITGHSTRRSGALQYIRKGWSVSQTGYLGRWKSNIIMEYAQEALETMAINSSKAFDNVQKNGQSAVTTETLSNLLSMKEQVGKKADTAVTERLKEELEALKTSTKGASEALHEAILGVEEKMGYSSKYLPPLVKSARHQVVHTNAKTLVYSASTSWRTTCGWYYYLSNYQFVEGDVTMVTCAKCLAAAQSKEAEGAA